MLESTEITAEWPPKKVVCAGTVVLDKNKVLLVRQAKGHSLEGQWSIPWGIVETDEPPDETAVRETVEESGITAEIEGLLGYQNFHWQSMLAFVYLCRHVSGEPASDGVETDQAGYFSLAELDILTDPIETWTNWLIRRVLSGNYHLIPPILDNPEQPLAAFF